MIPILYEKTETAFTSNGLGRLPDAISCTVTEERNGEYELLLEYPITGLHYADLELERIILAKPADQKQPQPFVIYQISKPISGIVTVNAEHISYRLTRMVVSPCSASSAAAAMGQIQSHIIGTHNFTFWSDRSQAGSFSLGAPAVVREVLGGMEGSVLDAFGGEYEFDEFTVKLWNARGVDRGISIRWEKNITGIEAETAGDSVYTGIVPFWTDNDGNCVYGSAVTSHEGHVQKTITMDFSSDFDEAPTAAQLEAKAASFLASNTPWVPSENISVNFVDLASTTEYQNLGLLQQVNLCDTIHVAYEPLGIDVAAKVIRTIYNVLLERYDEIEVGNYQRSNLAKEINAVKEETMQAVDLQRSFTQEAIDYATKLISGGYGGHIVIRTNANGEPEELLIMDTDDIETAVNVWRWNINGLGHSHSGYEGPYSDIAITMDGRINASMITSGSLIANIITAGVLQDAAGINYWNMATGELHITGATQVGNTTLSGMVNEKARVFITQPVPPYNVGDLWVQGSSGDIKECVTARASGSYTASDWAAASKYTDDSLAASKAKVYTSQPTPPYNVGDLYTNGSDLYRCSTARSTGSYSASDWTLATDYIDAADAGTIAEGKIGIYDTGLDQQKVFNRLTNNGALQGLYMQNGNLYINAAYIVAGRIASANGRIYFDLDNNELRCDRMISASTLSGVNGGSEIRVGPGDGVERPDSNAYAYVCVPGYEDYGLIFYVTKEASARISSDYLEIVVPTLYNYADTQFHYTCGPTTGDYRVCYVKSDRANNRIRISKNLNVTDNLTVSGSMTVSGTKSRDVDTENYNKRLAYCYEMASPIFGDIGEGVTDESGECCVNIDDIFSEMIRSDVEYQVFLQKEGQGDLWIQEKQAGYFVVKGTPNMRFAWELKAKQKGYEFERTDEFVPVEVMQPYEMEIDEWQNTASIYDDDFEKLLTELEGAVQ